LRADAYLVFENTLVWGKSKAEFTPFESIFKIESRANAKKITLTVGAATLSRQASYRWGTKERFLNGLIPLRNA
jgi:hypothetical protein